MVRLFDGKIGAFAYLLLILLYIPVRGGHRRHLS
jgi:hypothetical protein